MKLVYFKDEDPDNVYLVLEELENDYILGLLEYPDIEMDFTTPKDVVIEIQENTEEYEKAKCSAQPEDILRAINAEEQVYFQLLTEHCNDCTLFFCRSDGSSIETVLHELMNRKAEQTVEFFSHIYGKAPNADAIRLLMGSQFWHFRQLLDQHMEEGRMLTCLQAVLDFTNAGWRQLCDTLQ